MEKEKIQDFTRKISMANKTSLTVIVYEILFEYINDAIEALNVNGGRIERAGNIGSDEFKTSIYKADKCLIHLMQELDFKYGIAKQLYSEYSFCRKQLALAIARRSTEELINVKNIMRPLFEAFSEIAKKDDSEAVMRNAQFVYAGMTYGRSILNEESVVSSGSRGYWA